MKWHISFVLLLVFVLCLSGCAGRLDLPTSATEDTPQAAESEKSTRMTTEETTMPEIDTTKPMPVFHREYEYGGKERAVCRETTQKAPEMQKSSCKGSLS